MLPRIHSLFSFNLKQIKSYNQYQTLKMIQMLLIWIQMFKLVIISILKLYRFYVSFLKYHQIPSHRYKVEIVVISAILQCELNNTRQGHDAIVIIEQL